MSSLASEKEKRGGRLNRTPGIAGWGGAIGGSSLSLQVVGVGLLSGLLASRKEARLEEHEMGGEPAFKEWSPVVVHPLCSTAPGFVFREFHVLSQSCFL